MSGLTKPHPLSHIVLLTDFFRPVFVWCGFVSYHCQWKYTLCTVFKSIHISLEPHSTFFTTNNGSKIVLCAIGCTPQMDLFCTIETFFVPETDSIPHFMFLGSHTSQEGLIHVSHPLILGEGFERSGLQVAAPRGCWAADKQVALSRGLAHRTGLLACGCSRVAPCRADSRNTQP